MNNTTSHLSGPIYVRSGDSPGGLLSFSVSAIFSSVSFSEMGEEVSMGSGSGDVRIDDVIVFIDDSNLKFREQS